MRRRRVRSARTSTTRSRRTRARGCPSRRCATSSAGRSPTRNSRCRRTSFAARTRTTSRCTSRSAPATRTAASPPRTRPADDLDGGDDRRNDDAAAGPDGKAVYAKAGCGGCHTLKDAGSTGNVGPNLDQLKPAEATVAHQVENGGGVMPAFKSTLTRRRDRRGREVRLKSRREVVTRSRASRGRRRAGSRRRSRPRRARASRSSRRSAEPSSTPRCVERTARSCGWRSAAARAARCRSRGAARPGRRAARRSRSAAGRATARAAPPSARARRARSTTGRTPRCSRSRTRSTSLVVARGEEHEVPSRSRGPAAARAPIRPRARPRRAPRDERRAAPPGWAADRPARCSGRVVEIDDDVGDRIAKRSRAESTTPRSSQCERPGGCVEMISSSGRNVRIASSIACSGSPSPISPVGVEPGRAHRREAGGRAAPAPRRARRPRPRPSAGGASSAPGRRRARASGRPRALPDLGAAARSRRPSRSRRRGSGARPGGSQPAPARTGVSARAAAEEPPDDARREDDEHRDARPTSLISEPIDDQREVADRQPDEPERVGLAPEGIPHSRAREGRRSRRRRST